MPEITIKRNAFRKQVARIYVDPSTGYKMRITSKKFDCEEECCEVCIICRYQGWLDWVHSVGKPESSIIEYNKFLEKYFKFVYGG